MVFRRFLPAVVCCFLLLSARAQQDTLCVRGGDTLRYRYTPLPAPAPAAETQQQPKRKDNFWSRIFHGNVDRTFEKKIDFSFIGAPNYSKEASVGIGVLASGLYRVDRTDSLTPPSDVSFFGNFSLSGFYMFGVSGNTLFNHNRSRVIYEVSFGSKPLEFWGIGYEAGRFNQSADYIRKQVKFDAGYLYEVWRHLYVGGSVLFSHTKGTDFDDRGIDYLAGQKLHYTLSGIGMTLQYDSRDFIPAPERGTFLMVKQVIYPKGLGNSGKTLYKTTATADYYQRLWAAPCWPRIFSANSTVRECRGACWRSWAAVTGCAGIIWDVISTTTSFLARSSTVSVSGGASVAPCGAVRAMSFRRSNVSAGIRRCPTTGWVCAGSSNAA